MSQRAHRSLKKASIIKQIDTTRSIAQAPSSRRESSKKTRRRTTPRGKVTAANATAHVAAKPQEEGFELSGRGPSGIEAARRRAVGRAGIRAAAAARRTVAAPALSGPPPQHPPLGAVDGTFPQQERPLPWPRLGNGDNRPPKIAPRQRRSRGPRRLGSRSNRRPLATGNRRGPARRPATQESSP